MDSKEIELEDSRSTLQKRIKNLENQLDDEASERKKIVDQRKETEAKLQVKKVLNCFSKTQISAFATLHPRKK